MFHYKGHYIVTEQEVRVLEQGKYDLSLLCFKSYSHYSFFTSAPFGQRPIYGELYKVDPSALPSPIAAGAAVTVPSSAFLGTPATWGPTVSGLGFSSREYEMPEPVNLVSDLGAELYQLSFCDVDYDLYIFPDKCVLVKERGEGWDELRALYKDIYEFQQSVSITLPDGARKRAYFFLT